MFLWVLFLNKILSYIFQSDTKIVNEAYAIAKLGIVINSSINVVLYCISGKRFRRELSLILCSKVGCRFMVPMSDTSDMYSEEIRKRSGPSESGSRTGSQASLSTIFQRMDTPLE